MRLFQTATGMAFVVVAACAKSGAKSDTMVATRSQGSAQVRTGTPELDMKFDDMTNDDLWRNIKKYDFGHGKAHTPHRCNPKVQNCPSAGTDVTISPAQGIKDLGTVVDVNYINLPGSSTRSYLIARLDNVRKNGSVENWLGLQPGETVFWLVEPDPQKADHARSRFVRLGADPGAKVTWLDDIGPQLYWFCDHKTQRDQDEANFADCSNDKDQGGGTGIRSTNEDVTSTWGSCPGGCCATSNGTRPGPKTTEHPAARPATKRPST